MDGLRDLPDGSTIIEFDNAAQLTAYLRDFQKFRCALFVMPTQQGNGLLVTANFRVQRRYAFLPDQGDELVRLVKHVEEFARKSLFLNPVSLMCFENVTTGTSQYLLVPRLQTTFKDRQAFEKSMFDTLVQWVEPRIGFRLSTFSARHISMWSSLCERIHAWAMIGRLRVPVKAVNESHLRQLESGFPLALMRARLPEIEKIIGNMRAPKGITVVAMESFDEAVTLLRTLKLACELLGQPTVIVESNVPCLSRIPDGAAILLNAVDYSLHAGTRSWVFENAEYRHITIFLHRSDGAFRSVMRSVKATSSSEPVSIELLPFTHRQTADWLLSFSLPQDYEKIQQAVQGFSRRDFTVLRQLSVMLASSSYVADGSRLLADFKALFLQGSMITLDRAERRLVEIICLCLERPDTAIVDFLFGERAADALDKLRDQGIVDEINGWFLTCKKPEAFIEIDPSESDSLLADYFDAEGKVCLSCYHAIRSGSLNDARVFPVALKGIADQEAPNSSKMALFSLVFEQIERGRIDSDREILLGFVVEGARLFEDDVDYLRRMRDFLRKLRFDPLQESDVFLFYLEALKRQGRYVEALDQGVGFVRALGLNIQRAPTNMNVFFEVLKTWASILRSGGKIIKLGEVDTTSRRSDVLNRVLWVLGGAAYMSTPKLLAVFSAVGVRLGLRYGIQQESMLGVAGFAYIEQEIALQRVWPASAKRAIAILEEARKATESQSGFGYDVRADLVEFGMVRPWHDGQLMTSIDRLREAYFEGTRSGDEEYALYCAAIGALTHLIAGGNLDQITREIETPFIHAIQANQRTTIKNFIMLSRFVSDCTGSAWDYHENDVPALSEPKKLVNLFAIDRTAAAVFYALAGFRALILGDYCTLEVLADFDADAMIEGVQGQQLSILITFICMMAHLRMSKPKVLPDKVSRRQAAKRLKDLKRWAKSAPLNFDGIATLAAALYRHRLRGGALEDLARACDVCASRGQMHFAAIAREHLGYAELNVAQMVDGRNNLEMAAKCYEIWGASKKTSQLRSMAARVFSVERNDPGPTESISSIVPYIRIKQFESLYDPVGQTLSEYLGSAFQTLSAHGVTKVGIVDPQSRQEMSYCTRTRSWGDFLVWKPLRSLLAKARLERDKSVVDTASGEILVWLGANGGSEHFLYALIEDSSSQKVHVVFQALKRHRGTIGLALAARSKGSPETERLAEFTTAGTEELRAALDHLSALDSEYADEAKKLLSGVISARVEMAMFLRSSRFSGFGERVTVLEQTPLDGITKELLNPLNVLITESTEAESFLRVYEIQVDGERKVMLAAGSDNRDSVAIDYPVTAVKLLKAIIAKERRSNFNSGGMG